MIKFFSTGLRCEKGLTLVELLLVTALLGLALALGLTVYFFGTDSFTTGTSQAHHQQSARLVDEYFKNELRNAGRIVIAPEGMETGYDGYFKIESGALVHTGTVVGDNFIGDIVVEKVVTGEGKTLLAYSITTTEDRSFLFENQVLLNNIGSRQSFETLNPLDPDYPPSLNAYVLYYFIPGDPLPDGHAFIDLNNNRVYNSDVDIPVPVAELTEIFNTAGYESGYAQFAGRLGTGGSLIVPSTAGQIEIGSTGAKTLNWTACVDIVLAANVLVGKFEGSVLQATGNVEVMPGTAITARESLTINSDGRIKFDAAQVIDTNSNLNLVFEAEKDISLNYAVIEAEGSVSALSRDGDIFASGLVRNYISGSGHFILDTASHEAGKIVINNAEIRARNEFAIQAHQVVEANEVILKSDANTEIVIKAGESINLESAVLEPVNAGVTLETLSGGIYAAFLDIRGGNQPILVEADGDINLEHGDLLATGGEGRISITSTNGSIYAGEASLATATGIEGVYIFLKTGDTPGTSHALDVGGAELNSYDVVLDAGNFENGVYLEGTCFQAQNELYIFNAVDYSGEPLCGPLPLARGIAWEGPALGAGYIFSGLDFIEGYSLGVGSQEQSEDQLYLKGDQGEGVRGERTYVARVDLGGVDSIAIDWENTGNTSDLNASYLVISRVAGGNAVIAVRSLERGGQFGRVVEHIDVSDLEGEYYLRVHARNRHNTWNRHSEIRVYNLVLNGGDP